MKQTQSITKKHKHKGIMEEMEMAKKAEQVVPEIIDSVEGLNAKMAAMREAGVSDADIYLDKRSGADICNLHTGAG